MIVVDTNVIVYALIEGDRTALAQNVATKDPDWIVPPLWRHEFLNVLVTCVRGNVIEVQQAEDLLRTALGLLVRAEREVDGGAVLVLAVEHKISAYDAQYIALARRLETQCITEDRRLARTFPETAISMASFCAKSRATDPVP
ncbi:MAG: type II toxin-antitoxin system VapC family toxin [bacterium]|nr:type II toxin-antitoxin system VapC family toxin [bacterium]